MCDICVICFFIQNKPYKLEMAILFVNVQHFWEWTKIEWWSCSEKKWIMNKQFELFRGRKENIWTVSIVRTNFTEQTNFQKILKKKLVFLLKKQCFGTNSPKKNFCFFTQRTILMNEWFYKQFYWTIVQWENKRNRWKMSNIFENKLNQRFWTIEKKEWNGSFMIHEWWTK